MRRGSLHYNENVELRGTHAEQSTPWVWALNFMKSITYSFEPLRLMPLMIIHASYDHPCFMIDVLIAFQNNVLRLFETNRLH